MAISIGIGNYIRSSLYNRQGKKSPFHPSLVDYWSFAGKKNSDADRDVIKGIKGNILNAYNFSWSLGSGYGLYKENYNNFRQISGTTGVFSNTDHSIHITNVKTVAIPVTEISYKAGEVSPEYQIKVTGLLEGQWCGIGYFYNYPGDAKPPVQENTIKILKDGVYTVPSFTFPSDIKYGTSTRIVFNFAGDTDITIEQIPQYEGAIVTDGIDDYLKLDKVGYKIGTIILKYIPIPTVNRWQYVFDNTKQRNYIAYSSKDAVEYNQVTSSFLRVIDKGDYRYAVNNVPKEVSTPLVISSNVGLGEFLSMALYEIAIYEDILTDEEIQKEINIMEYGTPNPVFALNFDNFAYKAVDYPEFATGKVTTNKIVIDSTTTQMNGFIMAAYNPELTTGDAIELPSYKVKVTGIDAYGNIGDDYWAIALMGMPIDSSQEPWFYLIYKDGVYNIPAISLSDRVFNLSVMCQITGVNKPIEIEVLYDSSITTNFPSVKQIFP